MAVLPSVAGISLPSLVFQVSVFLAAYLLVFLVRRLFFANRQKRRLNGDGAEEPPCVFTWLPWIGCAFSFIRDRDGFIEESRRKHGDVFSAVMAGKKMVFVCDHSCLPDVLRRSRDLSFKEFKKNFILKAFGRGDFFTVLDCYPAISIEVSKRFRGDDLSETCVRFQDALRSLLSLSVLPGSNPIFFKNRPDDGRCLELNWRNWPNGGHSSSWHTVDLLSILKLNSAVNCDVLLGPGVSTQEFKDDVNNFAKLFKVLSLGLPEWLPLPSLQAALQARQRMYTAPYVVDFSPKASNIMYYRREAFLESVGSDKHKTFIDVALLFIGSVNTSPSIFWVLAYLLKNHDALKEIQQELGNVLGNDGFFSTDYRALREQLSGLIKLDSAISETLRLTSLGFTSRQAVEDTNLTVSGKNVLLRKNDNLLIPSRSLHLNADIFGEEVNEYRWNRFLDDSKTGPRRFVDRRTGQTVSMPLVAFGGGATLCPGRQFARDAIKIAVGTLLCNFDMELDSPNQSFPKYDMPAFIAMPDTGEKFLVKIRAGSRLQRGS